MFTFEVFSRCPFFCFLDFLASCVRRPVAVLSFESAEWKPLADWSPLASEPTRPHVDNLRETPPFMNGFFLSLAPTVSPLSLFLSVIVVAVMLFLLRFYFREEQKFSNKNFSREPLTISIRHVYFF